jgi:WhiB family redox-sensing transcriptional regulator
VGVVSRRVSGLHSRLRSRAAREAEPHLGPKALRAVLRELLFDGGAVPQWRRSAACRDEDPEAFYPPEGAWFSDLAEAAAKRICAGCPVRAACLADALDWESPRERHGVLGGLTAAERARLAAALRPGPADSDPAAGGGVSA